MTRFRTPWDEVPEAVRVRPAAPRGGPATPKRRGRRPVAGGTAALGGVVPGWVYHHLTASGPDAALAAFVAAARGPGTVPWRHDPAKIEEDALNLLLVQPAAERRLSAVGCRILVRQVLMAVNQRRRGTQE